jgi:hypothetical protein
MSLNQHYAGYRIPSEHLCISTPQTYHTHLNTPLYSPSTLIDVTDCALPFANALTPSSPAAAAAVAPATSTSKIEGSPLAALLLPPAGPTPAAAGTIVSCVADAICAAMCMLGWRSVTLKPRRVGGVSSLLLLPNPGPKPLLGMSLPGRPSCVTTETVSSEGCLSCFWNDGSLMMPTHTRSVDG